MRRSIVGEHHEMLAVLVLEVVVDALMLEEAADEIEIRFPVLYAIVQVRIGFVFQLQAVVGEIVLLGHFFENVRDSLALKNPAVRRQGQKPQPWSDERMIFVKISDEANLGKLGDYPAEVALAAAGLVASDRNFLTENLVRIEVAVFAQQGQRELERLADPLRTGELME